MSNAPASPANSRRPFGARASALRLCRRVLTGSLKLKDMRDSEKAEVLICLDQTADMLDRLKPVSQQVEDVLIRHETGLS